MTRHARLEDTGQKIASLSRGQKLIFHLNLILAARPEILLIDEVIHSLGVDRDDDGGRFNSTNFLDADYILRIDCPNKF
jgi:ABC-type uncharacterized transport system ATPase subunit